MITYHYVHKTHLKHTYAVKHRGVVELSPCLAISPTTLPCLLSSFSLSLPLKHSITPTHVGSLEVNEEYSSLFHTSCQHKSRVTSPLVVCG